MKPRHPKGQFCLKLLETGLTYGKASLFPEILVREDLAKLISEYNNLTSTVRKVEIADAMDNNFPWAPPDQCGGKLSYRDHYLSQYFFLPFFIYL